MAGRKKDRDIPRRHFVRGTDVEVVRVVRYPRRRKEWHLKEGLGTAVPDDQVEVR